MRILIASAVFCATTVGLFGFGGLPGGVTIDERTGAIAMVSGKDSPIVSGVSNIYHLMERAGDADARETEDAVLRKQSGEGWVSYVCGNPRLPDLEIEKRYEADEGGVRRTLSFTSRSSSPRYITPFTECHFDAGFQKGAWFIGAGYIGPYKPFPSVSAPRPVNEHKQSSKGLAFVHPNSGLGGFAHFRTKIDDVVVLPWWHSTISRYRELHDRLWYLPDGYRMGLGTFGLYPGKTVSVTDRFAAFDGDMFTFFDDIFAADRDFAAELKAIPPPPAWIDDCFAIVDAMNVDRVRFLSEMSDEGSLLVSHGCTPGACFSWCDYRYGSRFPTSRGGWATGPEVKGMFDEFKAFGPRIHTSIYGIAIATSWFTQVFKDHPEWFRRFDRHGNPDSLFPRVQNNWQTMFCNAECRRWIIDMLIKFSDDIGTDTVYLDESQMTNTIDWDRDQVTLDSDTVRFWRALLPRLHEKGKTFYANGSGIPYADINCMESPDELAPKRWRDWAGIGWGIGMMNRIRVGQRASPLYWNSRVDYANRVLALGWIPHTYLFGCDEFPVMRAVYQGGNMLPVNARYSPDWRRDDKVEVESHAVRREKSKDVLLSFINRGSVADIPVSIDLASLGFSHTDTVNVWKQNMDFALAGKDWGECPSDREAKTAWRQRGAVAGARITDPQLVYSGLASGMFDIVLKNLGTDRMEQILVTVAPLSFFALDDLPLNAFYTSQKHGRITGRTVVNDRRADVLIVSAGKSISGVTANGMAIPSRPADLRGTRGTLVTLAPGTWELAWSERDAPSAGERNEDAVKPACGPFKSKVVPRHGIYEKPRTELRQVNRKKDGAAVLRSGLYYSGCGIGFRMQPDIPISAVAVDADRLTLYAGTTRRESEADRMVNFSGFEFDSARLFRARFTHSFTSALGVGFDHMLLTTSDKGQHFVGMVIDYRVNGKYEKRIAVSCGAFSPENEIAMPPWGTARKPDEMFYAGEWIEEPSGKVFALDISKYAPMGWDGVAFVSIGTSRVACGRQIGLEFLSFNGGGNGDLVTLVPRSETRKCPPPLRSTRLRTKPRSLARIDAEEWQNWSRIDRFEKVKSGVAKARTRAYIAHDYEYIYVGVEAEEPGRKPICPHDVAYRNEHVELMLMRPDKKLYQVIADPTGRWHFYLARHSSDEHGGIIVRTEVEPDKGWRIFFAVPVDALRFNMQVTPVVIDADMFRVRLDPSEESGWTPVDGFFETSRYGQLVFDFE